MDGKGSSGNASTANSVRDSDDIRQDIAKGKLSISQTVDQIGERIEEKLDWREYVKNSPYGALGVAAALGYLASRVLTPRTTPMERIMRPITEEIRNSLGGMILKSTGPGLIKVTLIGIATKAAVGWAMNATSTDTANAEAGPQPQTGRDSTVSPRVDTQLHNTNMKTTR